MGIKEVLKSAIEGTGEVAEEIIGAVTGIVKEGSEDVSDVFGAVIDLGKEGVVDVTEGVKDVYVGAVKALTESGKTTEEAIEEVSSKAAGAIGKISEDSMETVGSAAKKGIEEAKGVLKKPLE